MRGNAELAGIVGDNDRGRHQPVMTERTPGGSFVQQLEQGPVEDIDRAPQQMLPPLHLRGEHLARMHRQPGDHGTLDSLRPQIIQCGFVDDIVLTAGPQQRQEVQARFRPAGAKDGKALAADLRGHTGTAGMPRTGIIDGDVRRGIQAGLQDRVVFLLECLQIRGEQAHDLPLGDRKADAVQKIGQALGGHLALRVQGQAEPPHAGPEPASEAGRQRRDDGLALRRHPAFPLVAHHLGGQNQIPPHDRLVAFEARAGRHLGPDRHLAGDLIPFGAAPGRRPGLGRPRLSGFLHAGRFERWARRQVLEPGDLVLQGLIAGVQVAVVEAQLLDLLLQSLIVGPQF